MKKKGFTLVEVIAVIAILGLLITMVTPTVMSNIKNKRNTLYENTVKEIEKVSSMYLTNNPDLYGKISNDGFTNISINSLCIDNLINCPVVDPRDDSEINGYVKVSYIDNKYEYEFINQEYINENILLNIILNGGSINENPEGTYKEGDLVEIGIPTKEGNDFVDWEVVKGNSKLNGNKLTIGSTDTILYAVWESYSNLVIDLDGGTSSNNQSGSYKSGTNIELVEPTKENYKFVGWEKVSGDGVLSGNTYTMGTEDTVIKAIWELNVFSLTVEPNGGTITQEFKNDYAVGETITLETPTRTGYTFTGWTATNGSIDNNVFTMGTSDVTLTANWEVNTYQINYELGGGTNDSGNSTSGTYGSTVTVNNPTRTGYTFTGWTVSGTGATLSGTNLTIGAGNVTLTANWSINSYTITTNYYYYYQNATWTHFDTKTDYVEYGNSFTPYSTGIPTGYYLAHYDYYTDSATLIGSGTVGSNSFIVDKNFIVNVHYYPNTYTISYNLNGGSYGSSVPTSGVYATTVTVSNPSRTGYTFAGWSVSGTGAILSGTNLTIGASNVTLTANWQANTYWLNLNILNPDGSEPWQNCEAGTFEMSVNGGAYTRVCNESGEHYPYGTVINFRNFSPGAGRYLSNVTGATNSGGVWTVTITGENVVEFKTGWNTYSISYNLNGGTNASGNPTSGTYGSTVTVNNPTRTGYKFTGWTVSGTGATLSGTKLTIGAGDVTLTASWQITNAIPTFTYTGSYQIVDDNDNVITTTTGNWKIRFLSSGTLTFTSLNGAENGIDVFLVGGGGGGSASGGGGGYTKTVKNVKVATSTSYSITIGAGGAQSVSGSGYDGSASSAFGATAAGGKVGTSGVYGGDGGSGGGGYTAGNGGSNGGNGASGGYAGGTGQGTTTREFGESSGKLYAGGGGAGHHKGGSSVGSGGSGGGGTGVIGDNRGYAGTANTGGGGGGGIYGDNGCGGAGGSGIVIIRNKR